MRAVFSLVLVVGVALAGSAVYMTQKYFNQSQAELAKERDLRAKTGPLVQIFAVNKVKKYGEVLTKDDVQMIFVQQSALPEHAFDKIEDLFPDDGKTPRYISRQMEKFTPVLTETVTEPGRPAGLSASLEKGESAFAVKVDMASGVAGFVNVGDRVDVYWTGSAGGTTEQGEMTRLIEGGVRVVGVDQQADNSVASEGVARTVTLAASREQVARLTQAAATGRLNLAIVGTDATGATSMIEVDSNGLLGITPEQAAAAPEAPKVCTLKTRKGTEVVETPIPCATN
ncbi:Flp pilus assembly protein CpaB [Rhodobacter sp. KR11]|uniref:Flp pilus assembly protein CpaB n=1 Tax=Rhodobacter sp. KR11 TaxID=2974588 RepID=UPI0022217408|nr:Flp pilus assembly protein CpaB [Rhodobacter sp. KR11]MCW1917383.1 Flp pilus assembly protein CpaB [Rhodobacter sp. KR11]